VTIQRVRAAVGVLVLLLAGSGCSGWAGVSPATTSTTAAFDFRDDGRIDTGGDWVRYVEIALGILEEHHRLSDDVDWDAVRTASFAILGDEPSQSRAHHAIETAIVTIGDPHTYFLRPGPRQVRDEEWATLPPPTGALVDGRIGHLAIPRTGLGETGSTLQDLAREISQSPVCGWVIDLRDYRGGSMVPALLGLGPFLGEGTFLAALLRAGLAQAWSYRDGELLVDGEPLDQAGEVWEGIPVEDRDAVTASGRLQTEPFVLPDPAVPVAVLISGWTASAGEWVVVAFKGREATRFFGQPTFGLPTGNAGWTFDDNGWLVVTGGVAVDRHGTVYTRSIPPDELVREIPGSDRDETLDAAVSWLFDQPNCTS
jgi:carboxyl-terminal processing protease